MNAHIPNPLMTALRPDTQAMIEQLLQFDTTSRNSNLGLIEWVRDWLKGHGITASFTYDKSRQKANLFATIAGVANPRNPGLVLSGHTDVVPVDGQDWNSNPFQANWRDDRLYARGSCDMKGFIGIALAQAPYFAAANLNTPIHYALSYDEEIGCMGVRCLIEELQKRDFQAAGCIVGEPTNMQVVVANKGMRTFCCTVHGRAAHSSLTPHGVNAIEYAAQIISYIRQVAKRMQKEEPRDNGFDVPFTTMQTGLIKGGIAENIIPSECVFNWEFRYLPGANADALENEIRQYAESLIPEMRHIAPEANIVIEKRSSITGLNTAETHRITQLAEALARKTQVVPTDSKAKTESSSMPTPTTDSILSLRDSRKVAYATEAGLFATMGIPAIICGPGSIAQAHQPNEFCQVEQLVQCQTFMQRLQDNITASAG